jgi:hypothetical protein
MHLTFNDKQTVVTEEYLKMLPAEVQEEFIDVINNVPFISNMVSPKRLRAKDLPRDEKGRIIVDLTNPHILEDMDYFRPAALHYKKYGCYTTLRPNANPNSEYARWLRTEIDRIWNGMVRPSDGEWIPGDLYFYWNYSPILQTKVEKGKKKGNRVIDFPEIWDSTYLWGHYIYQAIYGGKYNQNKGGEHFGVIARRGCGKSLFIAAMMAKQFICGENSEVNKSVKNVVVAADKQFLINDGTLNKFVDCIDFCADNTQFPSKRLKNSLGDMHWIMGYYDSDDQQIIRGTKNEVMGLSIKDKPGKIRGKRAVRTYFEEFGMFANFLETYNTALYNAEEGGYSFGTLGVIGTGGTKGNDFSGALEMIYHPEGYHMYPLPNVFDKATQGKGTCLFFVGAYMNRKGYYDEDGNSDVIGATLEALEERYKTKMTTGDPMSVTQKKAELPLTIQDCIMKVGGNIYPVADLQSRITELSLDPHAFDDVYVGKLNIVGGKVEFQATTDTPIRNFPHKDNKIEGAIEIFKMPEINGTTGNVFRNRYLMGVDPYDNDVAESLSLGSVLVLDAFTDNIVAEYTGRPQFADDFYEICRRLALFYDARITVENNKKGIYGYFSRMHSTYLLTDTFSYLRDKDLVKGESFGNTQKGVTATVPIKNYSRGLIRDWLLKPRTKTEIVNGEEVEISYPQLMDIRNLALLKELSMYNLDGNFDRHDALAMLMLYREDVYRLNAGEPAKRPEYENKFLKDSFFDTYNERANRKKKSPFAEKLILQ